MLRPVRGVFSLSRNGSIVSGVTNAMKVSREGVVLIKSFEGLRSRAVQRADGRWVIGYGHTASAREGLSVGEADAELLLQYDLIPVVRALHDQIETPLNQHQFDALASFVFSIGVDRFSGSDLLTSLNAGDVAQVADALAAWADDAQPETPIRRRAAERALFVAEPGAAVALADLLAAPLPLPPAAVGVEPEVEIQSGPVPAPSPPTSPAFHLYAPYRITAIGPLPGFTPLPATEDAPSIEPAVAANDAPPPVQVLESESAPVPPPVETTPTQEAPVTVPVFASPFVPIETPVETPVFAAAIGDNPIPEAETAFTLASADAETPPLVLTAPDAIHSPAERIVWPDAARVSEIVEPVLFDEAAVAEHLAIRNDVDARPPRRFDWSETGLFLVMGGIGLVSFGAAMAAFRRASEVGGGDTAMIGWVLAVIALACVSVSGFNLYQRFGRADRG